MDRRAFLKAALSVPIAGAAGARSGVSGARSPVPPECSGGLLLFNRYFSVMALGVGGTALKERWVLSAAVYERLQATASANGMDLRWLAPQSAWTAASDVDGLLIMIDGTTEDPTYRSLRALRDRRSGRSPKVTGWILMDHAGDPTSAYADVTPGEDEFCVSVATVDSVYLMAELLFGLFAPSGQHGMIGVDYADVYSVLVGQRLGYVSAAACGDGRLAHVAEGIAAELGQKSAATQPRLLSFCTGPGWAPGFEPLCAGFLAPLISVGASPLIIQHYVNPDYGNDWFSAGCLFEQPGSG